MKEFKGTPGKWVVDDSDVFTNSSIKGNVICLSPEDASLYHSAKYWEANAKLIAKAPEMLEKLQECYDFLKSVQAPVTPANQLRNDIKNLLNEIL